MSTIASPIPSITAGNSQAGAPSSTLPGGIGSATNSGTPAPQSTTNTPTTSNGAIVAPAMSPSSLPNPTKSATGPTGVASSDLATQTIATQQAGTNALDQSVQNHSNNKAATVANPAVSIVDMLNSKGLPSDYTSRAKMAQVAGIQNYVGSPQQNAQLIGWFNTTGGNTQATGASTQASGSGSTPGGSTSSTTGTSGTTGTPTPTGTPTVDANGNPITGSPGDQYNAKISDVQTQIGQAYDDFKSRTDQIINGTFPLTPSQQAVLDATSQQFAAISQQQLIANQSYERAVALAGNRLGTNIQNPAEYAAEGQKAISDDLQKINNLDATAAITLANLKQGFLDKDYTYINDQYNSLQKTLDSKNAALTALQTRTDTLYTSTRDYNEKVTEFAKSQEQQKSEFEQTQGLELSKLALQYPGLETTGPNAGTLKPGTDVSSLPGVVPVQPGINLGAKNVMFGNGSATEGTYQMVAKQNGLGFVSKAEQPAYIAIQSSLEGLNNALASGQIDPNATVSSTIGQKNPSSVITRLFQGTQPGNISTALGESKVNIPNDQNLKWKDVPAYLTAQMQSIAGIVPGEPEAKTAANALIAASNNGVSSQITSNPVLNSVYSQIF